MYMRLAALIAAHEDVTFVVDVDDVFIVGPLAAVATAFTDWRQQTLDAFEAPKFNVGKSK